MWGQQAEGWTGKPHLHVEANRCPAPRLSSNYSDFNLVLLLPETSTGTRGPLNSSFWSYHSRDLCGRLHKTFSTKSGSRGLSREPCRKPQKHILWPCSKIPTYVQFMQNSWQSCHETCNWPIRDGATSLGTDSTPVQWCGNIHWRVTVEKDVLPLKDMSMMHCLTIIFINNDSVPLEIVLVMYFNIFPHHDLSCYELLTLPTPWRTKTKTMIILTGT